MIEHSSAKPVHVLHVVSGDLWAGAEAQLYHLVRAQQTANDTPVQVAILNDGELASRLKQAGVAVRVLDEKKLSGLRLIRRLRALIRSEKIDLVHTHRMKENVLGAWAAWGCPGVVSIRTAHGADEFAGIRIPLHKRFYRKLDRWVGRRLQRRIVAVSEALGVQLAKIFPAGRVRVVENGIDVDEVRRAGAAPVQLPGPEKVVRVAFVGRLVPVKRVDLFLEMAEELERTQPGAFHFYIYGDGPLSAGLKKKAVASGMEKQVEWMGFVPDLPAHLARMNLLVIPSDHEGAPMNLLEALCLNVPVIAHRMGGMPHMLDEGRAGTLIDGQNPEDYAAQALAFLADPAPFHQRAGAGKKRVRECFDSPVVAAQYLALYHEVTGRA